MFEIKTFEKDDIESVISKLLAEADNVLPCSRHVNSGHVHHSSPPFRHQPEQENLNSPFHFRSRFVF